MNNTGRYDVIIAEDDDGHARLIQFGFEEAGSYGRLMRFRDGATAWKYLSEKSAPGLAPFGPRLLLLDIRMPDMGGIEVLRLVRGDQRFKDITVIMLTTSDEPKDRRLCFELGCDEYLVKPLDLREVAGIVSGLDLAARAVRH